MERTGADSLVMLLFAYDTGGEHKHRLDDVKRLVRLNNTSAKKVFWECIDDIEPDTVI